MGGDLPQVTSPVVLMGHEVLVSSMAACLAAYLCIPHPLLRVPCTEARLTLIETEYRLLLPQVVRREGPEAPQVNVPTAMEVLAGRTRGPSAAQAYPVPRSMEDLAYFPVMPSDHRNYALTWYSLSAATALLALRAARTR